MNDDDMKDVFIWGPAILVALLLCALFTCLGCSHVCPKCVPEVQTVEVQVPVYSCPSAPSLPSIEIPNLPVPPPEDATDEQIVEWYAEMVVAVKAREKALLDYIEYLQSVIDAYR